MFCARKVFGGAVVVVEYRGFGMRMAYVHNTRRARRKEAREGAGAVQWLVDIIILGQWKKKMRDYKQDETMLSTQLAYSDRDR